MVTNPCLYSGTVPEIYPLAQKGSKCELALALAVLESLQVTVGRSLVEECRLRLGGEQPKMPKDGSDVPIKSDLRFGAPKQFKAMLCLCLLT